MTDASTDAVAMSGAEPHGVAAPSRRGLLKGAAALGAAGGLAAVGISNATPAGANPNTPSSPVAVVAVANVTTSGLPTIDGYTVQNSDRILCVGQSTSSANGIWQAPSSGTGSWTRPTDFLTGSDARGVSVLVNGGSLYKGSLWMCPSTSTVTVDTTAQVWEMPAQSIASPAQVISSSIAPTYPSVALSDYLGYGQLQLGNGTSASSASLIYENGGGFNTTNRLTQNVGAGTSGIIYSPNAGSTPPTQHSPAVMSGISTSGAFNDSDTTDGAIFHMASVVSNPGGRDTVAVLGLGVGNNVFGGNFVAYANDSNDTAVGVEIDHGTQALGGKSVGLTVVATGSYFVDGPHIQMQCNTDGIEPDTGILFHTRLANPPTTTTDRHPVSSTGTLIKTDNTATFGKGIDFTGATFTTAAFVAGGNKVSGVSELGTNSVALAGLTGATAASRVVGATASGAPTSGTFAAGDLTVDQTGTTWVCVTAGSPGTWVSSGTRQPLIYTASHTLVRSDAHSIVGLSNASAVTLTVPTNASVAFPLGTEIKIAQYGNGKVTVAGTGVTINSVGGNKSLSAKYATATLTLYAADTWLLDGSLIA